MTMTDKRPPTELRVVGAPANYNFQLGPPQVLLLASHPESACAAREFVRRFIDHHMPDAGEDYIDNVVLIASELVTNSIRYGTEPNDCIRVVLDTDAHRTRVEVHDPVRRHPRMLPESGERDRGRGLVILDALCPGTWGVTDIPMGKSVWAEVKAT
ncbi:ATP-binding protein [Streptomyces sp. NPDC055059]